ncbi:MAG: protoporphyrinogen/coproporphyrinogen oxidase [Rhodospirillaceae bacterium]
MTARHVTIIGAGFSGLSAAYELNRAGYSTEIIERNAAPGGLISTLHTEWGLVETAASGALSTVRLEALAQDIGVQLLCPARTARRRYIYRGAPRRFPLRAAEWPRFARFVATLALHRSAVAPRPQESIRTWATRVMGEGAARYLVEGALQGIYSGNPERLSASLILGRFFDKMPRGPRPRQRGLVAPAGGMGELIAALSDKLRKRGVAFRTDTAFTFDGRPRHPHVIATGAASARALLDGVAPELAATLRSFELSTMLTITAFFREYSIHGFGCLFPPSERRRALGVLVNTDIFPNRSTSYVSETWILGGASGASALRASDLMQLTDEQLIDLIVDERRSAFGNDERPVGYRVTRWPESIPHYSVDLELALPKLQHGTNNVFLHGNYMGHIGLAKILDRAAALPAQIESRGCWH